MQHRRRSKLILGVLTLTVLVGATLTTHPAQAASGPAPYYAAPAWDQKIAPATRFLVLTNWNSEAVLDKETGLVWERSPASTIHTWANARVQCTSRTTGNRKGWRLPSVHELASLVAPNNPGGNPDLSPGHPFTNVQSLGYWSATTNADNPTRAWDVYFNNGFVHYDSKADSGLAWCVRGGMHADQY